jgi:AMP-activated protein kinase-like protein
MRDENPELSRHLDGETPAESLPPALRREADQWERLLSHVDRQPVFLPDDLRDRVMAQVRLGPAPGETGRWHRFQTLPRLARTPLGWGLAAAAILAAIWLNAPGTDIEHHDTPGQATAGVPRTTATTTFTLHGARARSVALTGDFLAWDPQGVPLHEGPAGEWTVQLDLEPGVHRYTFIVDGREWRDDPSAIPLTDDFGETRSAVVIPSPLES